MHPEMEKRAPPPADCKADEECRGPHKEAREHEKHEIAHGDMGMDNKVPRESTLADGFGPSAEAPVYVDGEAAKQGEHQQ